MNEQDGITIRGREHLTPDERHGLDRANQICAQVSPEVGFDLEGVEQVAACVDFVHGHMDEPEFWERARAEMQHRLTTYNFSNRNNRSCHSEIPPLADWPAAGNSILLTAVCSTNQRAFHDW